MFKNVMKDERGLSLVELLAVVVIMAIIAGIGAVAISSVIQKNREDAGISNVQSLVQAGNLYQMSEPASSAIPTTGDDIHAGILKTKNYISQIGFLTTTDGTKVTYNTTDEGKILITVVAGELKAGSRPSRLLTKLNEEEVSKLTRDQLWKTGLNGVAAGGSTTPPGDE